MTGPIETACIAFVEHPTGDLRWDELTSVERCAAWLGMDAAIAAYERACWVKAEDVPGQWEERRVLFRWPDGRVEERWLPERFSREPRHCAGLMVRLMPAWPDQEPAP